MTRAARNASLCLASSLVLLNVAALARSRSAAAAGAVLLAEAALLPFLLFWSWRAFRERRG